MKSEKCAEGIPLGKSVPKASLWEKVKSEGFRSVVSRFQGTGCRVQGTGYRVHAVMSLGLNQDISLDIKVIYNKTTNF